MLKDRVKALEELWEHDHHTIELLSIYIPRLTDILIRYWGASGKHRGAVIRDLGVITNAINEHNKFHYFDKKKREGYASKRKPTDTNKLNNIYRGVGIGEGSAE